MRNPSESESPASEELSVSAFVQQLKSIIEGSGARYRLVGEVSEIARPRSGHLYITLKDERSELSVVCWRAFAQRIDFQIKEGDLVSCRGYPTVYPARGRLQFVAESFRPSGEGVLRREYERLKAELAQEGLFSAERKLQLPSFPRRIGIITSGTGAVLHDFAVRSRARFPGLQIVLFDARVQGEGAEEEIVDGLRAFSRIAKRKSGGVDLVVIARGGGSLEDLWCFNSERLVRAVAAFSLPVVSAVGHETDTTLCDLVADLRAPTPSAAAELIVPDVRVLLRELDILRERLFRKEGTLFGREQQIDELSMRLRSSIREFELFASKRIDRVAARLNLTHVAGVVRSRSEQLGTLNARLRRGVRGVSVSSEQQLQNISRRLLAISPSMRLMEQRKNLSRAATSLSRVADRAFRNEGARLARIEARLEALHPKQMVKRGYAMVKQDGVIRTGVEQLNLQDDFQVDMRGGEVTVRASSMKGDKKG